MLMTLMEKKIKIAAVTSCACVCRWAAPPFVPSSLTTMDLTPSIKPTASTLVTALRGLISVFLREVQFHMNLQPRVVTLARGARSMVAREEHANKKRSPILVTLLRGARLTDFMAVQLIINWSPMTVTLFNIPISIVAMDSHHKTITNSGDVT